MATKKTTGAAKVRTYGAAKKNNNNPQALRFLYRNTKNDTGIRTVTNPITKATRNGFVIVGMDMDKNALRTFRMDKMTVL